MADHNLGIKATADVDQANSSLNRLNGTLGKLGGAVKGFGNVAASVFGGLAIDRVLQATIGFLSESVDEALNAEKAFARLGATLDNIGRSDVFSRMSQGASDLAKQFGFLDNDDIAGVFEKLVTFGKLTEKQINDLLPVIIDFAAKQRIALPEASDAIIRALEGQGRALKVYGINMNDAKNTTEALGVVMTELAPKVEGAAKTFGSTTAGQIAITKQQIADLKEEIGTNLLPTVQKFYSTIADLLEKFNALSKLSLWEKLKVGFKIPGARENLDKMIALSKIESPPLLDAGKWGAINKEAENLTKTLGGGDPNELFNPPAIKKIRAKKEPVEIPIKPKVTLTRDFIKEADDEIMRNFGGKEGLVIPLSIAIDPETTKALGEFGDVELAKLENKLDKVKEFSEELNAQLQSAFSDVISSIGSGIGAMLAGVGGGMNLAQIALVGLADVLINVGKMAIATGVAIIGIKAALESLNPALAIAGGVALVALGTAVKAKLNSAPKFADGGIITGPTFGLIGEAGPEAVLPLDVLNKMLNGNNNQPQFVISNEIHMDQLVTAIRKAEKRQSRSYGI